MERLSALFTSVLLLLLSYSVVTSYSPLLPAPPLTEDSTHVENVVFQTYSYLALPSLVLAGLSTILLSRIADQSPQLSSRQRAFSLSMASLAPLLGVNRRSSVFRDHESSTIYSAVVRVSLCYYLVFALARLHYAFGLNSDLLARTTLYVECVVATLAFLVFLYALTRWILFKSFSKFAIVVNNVVLLMHGTGCLFVPEAYYRALFRVFGTYAVIDPYHYADLIPLVPGLALTGWLLFMITPPKSAVKQQLRKKKLSELKEKVQEVKEIAQEVKEIEQDERNEGKNEAAEVMTQSEKEVGEKSPEESGNALEATLSFAMKTTNEKTSGGVEKAPSKSEGSAESTPKGTLRRSQSTQKVNIGKWFVIHFVLSCVFGCLLRSLLGIAYAIALARISKLTYVYLATAACFFTLHLSLFIVTLGCEPWIM